MKTLYRDILHVGNEEGKKSLFVIGVHAEQKQNIKYSQSSTDLLKHKQ